MSTSAKSGRSGSGKSVKAKAEGTSVSKSSKAVVPRSSRSVATKTQGAVSHGNSRQTGERSLIAPKDYKMRAVAPAKNYDVVSFARTMNEDFGGKVKKLFDPEREAALTAQQTGIYIGWRCPEFTWDCQRVSDSSKCFCGHLLAEHAKYTANSSLVPCKQGRCKCKGYAWIPSRPEEIGEYWFQRRRDFDVTTWRAKCRCKHTHEDHDPNGLRGCKQCRCSSFDSPFLCAACDRHWENHQTFFMSASERAQKGMPVGEDYIPFAEIPSLRNMVLTGEDDEDMSYMKALPSPYQRPLPSSNPPADNSTVVPFSGQRGTGRGSSGEKTSGFRPVYD